MTRQPQGAQIDPKGPDGHLRGYSVAVPSGRTLCTDGNFEWKALYGSRWGPIWKDIVAPIRQMLKDAETSFFKSRLAHLSTELPRRTAQGAPFNQTPPRVCPRHVFPLQGGVQPSLLRQPFSFLGRYVFHYLSLLLYSVLYISIYTSICCYVFQYVSIVSICFYILLFFISYFSI